MEKNEINIILNEISFTNICKEGFIKYIGYSGRTEAYLTKSDIKYILENGYFDKKVGQDTVRIYLEVNKDIIKEIIRRSPMYSNILE